jgi:hypothetical protein
MRETRHRTVPGTTFSAPYGVAVYGADRCYKWNNNTESKKLEANLMNDLWSVYLHSAHTLGADHARLPAYVQQLLDLLIEYEAIGSYDPLVIEVRFNVRSKTRDDAIGTAKGVLGSALCKVNFPDPLDVVFSDAQPRINQLISPLRGLSRGGATDEG